MGINIGNNMMGMNMGNSAKACLDNPPPTQFKKSNHKNAPPGAFLRFDFLNCGGGCPGFGARPGFGAVSHINPHHIVSHINPHHIVSYINPHIISYINPHMLLKSIKI